MLKLVTIIRCIPLAILCAPLSASASDGDPVYSIEFRVLGWDSASRDIYYVNQGERQRLIAPVSRPSSIYTYTGTSPLQIYRFDPADEAADAEVGTEAVGALDLINVPSTFLLLIRNDPTDPERIKLSAMPDPVDMQSGGGIRFVNMTSNPMACLINDNTWVLGPGQIRHVEGDPRPDNSLIMRIAVRREDTWERVFSTVIGHRPNQQTTLFIIPDPSSASGINVRRIVEPVRR